MQPGVQNLNQKVCLKHNQPAFFFDYLLNQSICIICIQEKTGMLQFDKIEKIKQKTSSQSIEIFQKEYVQLQQILDSLLSYKQNIINAIDKIIQIIIDQINKTNSFKNKFEYQLASTKQLDAFDQLKDQLKDYKDNHYQRINQVKQLLAKFQQNTIKNFYLDQILENYIERMDNEEKKIKNKFFNQVLETLEDKFQTNVSEKQIEKMYNQDDQNQVKLQYELIRKVGTQEDEACQAFAFNKDNTILIVAQSTIIKIYQFNNGELGKELQTLDDHIYPVNCLYFMKLQNHFISGSMDQTIIIWEQFKNYEWVPIQKLTEHIGFVNCILMNKKEDLLISGSDDDYIKFWSKANDKWSCYQTIDTENSVLSISLNETENKLISCGYKDYVVVMEVKDNKQWIIKEKINVEEYGYRLSFTFENQFVFQPITKDYLEVYNYDKSSDQFRKQQQINIQSCEESNTLFPCNYVNSLKILLVKHGEYLNIFRINEERKYELIQTIKYNENRFFGTVSSDGKYLITSKSKSKEIQVRRMKKIEL